MKAIVKEILLVIALVLTCPLWILVKLFRILGIGDQLFLTFGQLLSMIPGFVGVYFRRAYYLMTLQNCSRDCFIGFGTWFSRSQATIASNVYVGERCSIGMVCIGENVLIGSNVDILSGKNQHNFDDLDRPIKEQGGKFEEVQIGDGAWIGNSTVILANIGANSIVGAGSVVVNSIDDHSIAVGNPAKVVKSRIDESN